MHRFENVIKMLLKNYIVSLKQTDPHVSVSVNILVRMDVSVLVSMGMKKSIYIYLIQIE